MNLWLRVLWVYLRAFFGKRLEVLQTSIVRLRVFPNDLDSYGHVNNGRYLTLMDLGRLDLIIRTGMGRAARQNRWSPLVGSVQIEYRKSLRPFQPFEVHTRVIGWDKKWFYMEQLFWCGKKQMARAIVKGLFRGPRHSVSPLHVLQMIGGPEESPMLPEELVKSKINLF